MHLGPVTQPDLGAEGPNRKAYFYVVVPDATLRHRIQSDLLCFALLVTLSLDAALQAVVEHSLGPHRLEIGWCTHKYTMTASGAGLQSAKGSGGRTHCYLMACPNLPDDHRRVYLADIYHTVQWDISNRTVFLSVFTAFIVVGRFSPERLLGSCP